MRTTISVPVTPQEAAKTRRLARKRGFASVSQYIRFLLAEDDKDLISLEEVRQISKEADRLHKEGKLREVKSLRELLP